MQGLSNRPHLTEQVVEYMTRMITEQVWPASTILPPEDRLARELGVSRTVIRESVKVLASRGMVRVQQGRGTCVSASTDWTVTVPLALLVRTERSALLEWLEVRLILEVDCAALAAQRATPDDHTQLREALTRLEQTGEDANAYCEADIHLHLSIGHASHNQALARLLHPIVQPLREQLRDTALISLARQAADQEHRAIVACILAGDPVGARTEMENHLKRVVSEISTIISNNQNPHASAAEPGSEAHT